MGGPMSCHCPEKIIPLQNITLNYSDILLPLGEGGKYQLKAKLYPENTTDEIAWKIDDGGVARVNQSGLVSSRSAGEATITVYSKTRPSVKAVCKVKVDDVRLRFRRDEVTGQKELQQVSTTWSSNPHLERSSGTSSNSSQPTKEEPPSSLKHIPTT